MQKTCLDVCTGYPKFIIEKVRTRLFRPVTQSYRSNSHDDLLTLDVHDENKLLIYVFSSMIWEGLAPYQSHLTQGALSLIQTIQSSNSQTKKYHFENPFLSKSGREITLLEA